MQLCRDFPQRNRDGIHSESAIPAEAGVLRIGPRVAAAPPSRSQAPTRSGGVFSLVEDKFETRTDYLKRPGSLSKMYTSSTWRIRTDFPECRHASKRARIASRGD